MSFWIFFTKLADTNVLVPLAFVLAAWLACERRWRAAFCWLFLFGAGLGIVAATKVAYVGWGIGIESIDFKGFSGHAMRAAAVAPVLGYLLLQNRSRLAVSLTLLLAIAFAIGIAVSRLILHEHSVSEVVSGLLLGSAMGFGFLMLEQTRPIMPLSKSIIAVCLLLASTGVLAKPAPTERWIEGVALYLSGHDKPYPHRLNRHVIDAP